MKTEMNGAFVAIGEREIFEARVLGNRADIAIQTSAQRDSEKVKQNTVFHLHDLAQEKKIILLGVRQKKIENGH